MRIKINKLTEDFIVECSVTEKCDDVTRRVAELHNLRLRIRRLVAGVRHLAKHGPMKEPDKFGLSPEQINAKGNEMAMPEHSDPLGMRVGKPCEHPMATKTLEKCAADAEQLVSNQLFKMNQPTDIDAIKEAMDMIAGAVKIAYPMGLPEWDAVQCALDDMEDLGGKEDSKHVVDVDTCTLWFAGKQLMRGEELMSKYCGKNDKCIIKAKLEKKGAGAPQREPAIDQETKKAMMTRWHKKQAEQKKLEEDDDDAYANSSWANPKTWKNDIQGVGGVQWRPGQ